MLPKHLIVTELYTVAEGIRWRKQECWGITQSPQNVVHSHYTPYHPTSPTNYHVIKADTLVMFLGTVVRVPVPNPHTGMLLPSGRKQKPPTSVWYLFYSLGRNQTMWLLQHVVEKNIWPRIRRNYLGLGNLEQSE